MAADLAPRPVARQQARLAAPGCADGGASSGPPVASLPWLQLSTQGGAAQSRRGRNSLCGGQGTTAPSGGALCALIESRDLCRARARASRRLASESCDKVSALRRLTACALSSLRARWVVSVSVDARPAHAAVLRKVRAGWSLPATEYRTAPRNPTMADTVMRTAAMPTHSKPAARAASARLLAARAGPSRRAAAATGHRV